MGRSKASWFNLNRVPVSFIRCEEREFGIVPSEKEPKVVTVYRRVNGIMEPVHTITYVGEVKTLLFS